MLTLMFKVWGDMIYGINHAFQGLSVGMEGGIKRYLVKRIDYGSGFDKSLMESILVHLMLIEKCDSLPLRLGSQWMFIALSFGVSSFWLYAEGWPWRRPLACEVCLCELIILHIIWFTV